MVESKFTPINMKSNSNPWTQEDDNLLHKIVEEVGRTKWSLVSTILNQQSSIHPRTSKQCRERWINYANPNINKSYMNQEEKKKIYELHKTFGSKWVVIANHLNGRTENSVKNFFYSDQRKKLRRQKKKVQKELESRNGTESNQSLSTSQDLNNSFFFIQNSNFANQVIGNIGSSFFLPSNCFSFNLNAYLYDESCLNSYSRNIDFQCRAFSENYSGL